MMLKLEERGSTEARMNVGFNDEISRCGLQG